MRITIAARVGPNTKMRTHLPAAAKELAESSKSFKLAAIPSIGRLCITATLLPVLENGDCAGTVRSGAPDPAYAAPIEHKIVNNA